MENVDEILEKLRMIESVSEIMMLSYGENPQNTEGEAYVTCLDLICQEADNIRKLIQK